MDRVFERLGSWVLPRNLNDIRLESTPQYNPCEDETQNEQIFPQLAKELVLKFPKCLTQTVGDRQMTPKKDDGQKLSRGGNSKLWSYHATQLLVADFEQEANKNDYID